MGRSNSNKFRKRLTELGRIKPWPAWFDVFLGEIKAYQKCHGHCRVPQSYLCDDGYRLGARVSSVRHNKSRHLPEMIAELDALKFVWVVCEWFPEFLSHMKEYKKTHGHCRVPKSYKCPDGYALGMRVSDVRTRKKDKKRVSPTSEMIAALDLLGFVWNGNEWFPQFLKRLKEYHAKFGDYSPAQSYKCPDGYQLGVRTNSIRSSRNGGGQVKVTPEMVTELDALGFVWSLRGSSKPTPE